MFHAYRNVAARSRRHTALLVLNEDGADGATTFVDQADPAHTMTAVGNFQWDTAQAPTGLASSGLSDGTGDYISTPDNLDLELGANDFTLEAMVRFNALPGASAIMSFIGKWNAFTNYSYLFALLNNAGTYEFRLYHTTNGQTVNSVQVSWTPSTATWYHVAACRNAGTLRFFADGVQQGSNQTLTAILFNGSAITTVGASGADGHSLNGWIASARISRFARYTADFTPPSLPLVAD